MRQSRRRWLLSLPILISVGVMGFVGVNKTESDKKGEENVLTLIESDLGLKKPLQVEPPFSESEPNQENNHWKVEVEEPEAVDKDASSPLMNEDSNPPLKEEGEPSNPSQMETLPDFKPPIEDDSVDEDLPQPPVMEEGSEDESENENENDIEEDQEETIQEIVPPQIEIEEIGKQLKVTITHELLTGSEEEELQYRIDYQEWEIYEAPFYLPIDDYVIESQLVMGETVSASAKENVLPKLPTLEAPRIEVTAEKYRAEVSLSHPRFEGLSEEAIEYRIENQEWQPYEKPFDWLPEWQSLEVRYREGSRVSEVKREIIAFEHPICERGNATKESPCVITTPEQLNALQLYVNEEQLETAGRYYELGNDLDFEGYDNDDNPDNGNWTPIGTLDLGFEGIFDGKNYVLKNIRINLLSEEYLGLFGYVKNSLIENVILENVEVKGRSKIGSLIGEMSRTRVGNSHSKGKVEAYSHYSGGLIGWANRGSIIDKSSFNGYVEGNGGVGGLTGEIYIDSQILNSYTTAKVRGVYGVGGLTGIANNNAVISNSYTKANLHAKREVGGLTGWNIVNSQINQSYAIAEIEAETDNSKGGLVGLGNGGSVFNSYWKLNFPNISTTKDGIELTVAQMTGFNALNYMKGFDFDNTWQLCQGDYPQLKIFATCTPLQAGYTGGSGTEEDPYLISSEQQLDWLRFEVNELGVNTSGIYYALTNHLDFSTYDSDGIDENGNWTPIGSSNSYFRGVLNGRGHVIRNYRVITPGKSYVGLFAHTSNSVIRDLIIDKVTLEGLNFVGGLVGRHHNSSMLENIQLSGVVKGKGSYIGGLIGSDFNNSRIKNVSTAGYVEGVVDVGGLVGHHSTSQIEMSYSTASVMGNEAVGGLTGNNQGNSLIKNCYAAGEVNGENFVGGLTGRNIAPATIQNSFAVGEVKGKDFAGGLVGKNYYEEFHGNYWDIETTSQQDSMLGAGLTTSQMTGLNAINYMEGFDFENTWQACEGDYPQLKVFATCQPASQPSKNQEELTSVEEEKPLMEEEMADAINKSSDSEEETNPEIEAVLVETTSESEVVEEEEGVMIESEKIDVIEEDILPIEENEDYFLKEVQEGDELSEEINLKEGEEGAYIIESEKTTEKDVVFLNERKPRIGRSRGLKDLTSDWKFYIMERAY